MPPSLFPGFDGLMTLSRREGVDIRPTLLRVLTDLYVQTPTHSSDEERQFVELASRLIDEVDDATREAVRARLAIYPAAPAVIAERLALPEPSVWPLPLARAIATEPEPAAAKPLSDAAIRMAARVAMQPTDAAQISEMFFAANSSDRAKILHSIAETPLRAAARVPSLRAERAIDALDMAAFVADAATFTDEIANVLLLPGASAARVVDDEGGEPLACALKALGMPSPAFQRVLLFLDPLRGIQVDRVYRLSRLYDHLEERTALVMLAAWRGASVAVTRAKYRPMLHDDERHRARAAAAPIRSTSTATAPRLTGTRDAKP